MTESCDLASKHCVPCRGGVPPLTERERAPLLAELGATGGGGWHVVDGHHLRKEYCHRLHSFPLVGAAFRSAGFQFSTQFISDHRTYLSWCSREFHLFTFATLVRGSP